MASFTLTGTGDRHHRAAPVEVAIIVTIIIQSSSQPLPLPVAASTTIMQLFWKYSIVRICRGSSVHSFPLKQHGGNGLENFISWPILGAKIIFSIWYVNISLKSSSCFYLVFVSTTTISKSTIYLLLRYWDGFNITAITNNVSAWCIYTYHVILPIVFEYGGWVYYG